LLTSAKELQDARRQRDLKRLEGLWLEVQMLSFPVAYIVGRWQSIGVALGELGGCHDNPGCALLVRRACELNALLGGAGEPTEAESDEVLGRLWAAAMDL